MDSPINLLQQLSKKDSSYSTIAIYLLDHLELVPSMNIHELAKSCYTSAPTIVRMCQKMGFSGFAQFKLSFQNYLVQEEYQVKADYNVAYVYENKQISEITNIVTNLSVNAMVESTHYLYEDLVMKIVDLLYQAERIDFYGAGLSNVIAKDFQYRFLRSGKNCTAFSENDTMYSQAQWANKKTVAIGISYSGENENIYKIMTAAQSHGATTISFTSDKENRLSTLCEYNLYVHSIEKPDGYIAASSRISMLHIMDIIFSVYASTYKDEVVHNVARTKPINRLD